MANESVFKRYEGNPIVTAKAVPRANSIHNSAIVKFGDGYAGIFRVDEVNFHYVLHVGWSRDGIHWQIDPNPIQMASDDPEIAVSPTSYDPRVTCIDGTYYVTWCNATAQGPQIGLAVTQDFKRFKQMENPLPTANRNCVIFPRKINGKFAIYHRPSDRGHTPFGDIFYATSPDLIHWGCHRFVFGPQGGWQSTKVGPGPAPIETPEGWLLIYHGVWTSCNGYLYYAGGALLDLEKPWKVIARTQDYLLGPTEPYERVGDVPNVVFPSSAVVEGDNLRLYYGCADTCIGMAEAKVSEIVDFVKTHSF
ncbi:MAG: glycoside hydrolase family 130 protein [Anaerolinea sp.]|nr:glycoside hydrolase family 130 protein [Anaerolinea sp.]MCC6972793.1 glycoside hydrolase family 130 protein [Anaerolineae bacterium]CAG1015507.1 Beta-1,4-mannooligosaccharide phosphorylase [Anaerolineae bacterium]